MGVARGDIALLRRGLESCMLVAEPTLEQIAAIARKTSTNVNSILRFFKLPIPFSTILGLIVPPTAAVSIADSPNDFNLCAAARETAAIVR